MLELKNYSYSAPEDVEKDKIKEKTIELQEAIAELQNVLYAQRKYSILIILQGMDASGKDGATKSVLASCNPTGTETHAFKKPTDLEFAHDFLWRVHQQTPAKGIIKVFNRSHYEDILIQRVHQWITEDKVKDRMKAINGFEETLINDNDTVIVKCYMHISKEKQLEKLQERIDNPKKNWKHNAADWEERKSWELYMKCYQDAINTCDSIPWHIIPCDQEWYRDYVVCHLLYETLSKLDLKYPTIKK